MRQERDDLKAELSLDQDASHLSAEFLEECRELLPAARESLESFQARGLPADLQALRHFFHTIAGVAAPMGFPLMGAVAGMSEEFIALVNACKVEPGAASVHLLSRGLDDLEKFLHSQKVQAEAAWVKVGAGTAAASKVDLGGQRILIIDDDPLSARLVELCLTKAGATTRHCKHPQDALRMVKAERPDLILLDLVMPGQDGFETCGQLRADVSSERIPIIFLTGQRDAEGHLQALRLGGDDYLTKPFEPDTLARRVSAQLVKRAREKESANRDQLTGAFNYRHLKQRLGEELARSPATSFCFAMINLDHFRTFNDAHGRTAGDEVLRALVERTRAVLRRADVVARYGGDLLALILAETDLAQAQGILDRLLLTVRASAFSLKPGAALTVSIGVTEAQPGDSVGTLIERADAALGLAKSRGRDQLVVEGKGPSALAGPAPESRAQEL